MKIMYKVNNNNTTGNKHVEELLFKSSLFIAYLVALIRSHLQCWDQFFVLAGNSILYFLPIVYNYRRKVYEYSSNVQGFLDSTLIYRMKLQTQNSLFITFGPSKRIMHSITLQVSIISRKTAFYIGNSIQILTPILLFPLFQTTVNHK